MTPAQFRNRCHKIAVSIFFNHYIELPFHGEKVGLLPSGSKAIFIQKGKSYQIRKRFDI